MYAHFRPDAAPGQKRALYLPELNLQAVMSVARYECWKQNSVLYKGSKWS